MQVVASNCGCCAVKHIRDFPVRPDLKCYITSAGHDEEQNSTMPSAYTAWNYEGADKLITGEEAFRMLVAEIKQRRPAGIITLNLVEDFEGYYDDYCCEDCNGCSEEEWKEKQGEAGYDDRMIRAWDPLLTELGFTSVVVRNSNSGNKIHHYTLVYDEWDGDKENENDSEHN